MNCPNCGAETYTSMGGKEICPSCGCGSSLFDRLIASTARAEREKALWRRPRISSNFGPRLPRQKYEAISGELLTEISELPYRTIERGWWALHVFYRFKGTRSEGQHGVLIHKGEIVESSQVGEIIETDLGKIKYYLHPSDMEHPGDMTGWNFADSSKIRVSWELEREELERLAYHEAGHAVMSYLLRRGHANPYTIPLDEFEKVTIQGKRQDWSNTTFGLDSLISAAQVLIAGHKSEIIKCNLSDDVLHYDSARDIETACGLIAAFVEEMARDSEAVDELTPKILEERSETAETELRRYWPAVEALAQALLKQKTLIGKEAVKIIEAAIANQEDNSRAFLSRLVSFLRSAFS